MAVTIPGMPVTNCARCGGDHAGLEFKPFHRPPELPGDPVTHWAVCPTVQSPILVTIRQAPVPATMVGVPTHMGHALSCPLSDPETYVNPVLSGLQCTCDTERIEKGKKR